MSTPSTVPTYNLQVVVRETGIKPDTLRAWERRYGLPEPERTPGGHRLYSQFDVEVIKWLQARQAEGMRINQAVDLWQTMLSEGQLPLNTLPFVENKTQAASIGLVYGETLERLREQWIEACMAFDESSAENLLTQAFARYPMETVCSTILRQGLSEIGDLWYAGESTVQQEHFASALAIRRLDALLAAAPKPTRRSKILIGCPPGEEHIFAPLMITVFQRYRGYDVIYLGANIPLQQFTDTVNSTLPDLIVMTAQQLTTAASLYETAQVLQTTNVPLGFGGLIFNLVPNLRKRIPGHYLGDTIEQAVQEIEQLILNPLTFSAIQLTSQAYQSAYAAFTHKRPLIETHLWGMLQNYGVQDPNLEHATKILGDDIKAGLILGDLDYLKYDLDWIKGLLVNLQDSSKILPHYLDYYKQSVDNYLSETGKPITDLLTRTVKKLEF